MKLLALIPAGCFFISAYLFYLTTKSQDVFISVLILVGAVFFLLIGVNSALELFYHFRFRQGIEKLNSFRKKFFLSEFSISENSKPGGLEDIFGKNFKINNPF